MVTEDDVRDIALSLPETTEKQAYGVMQGFRVRDKGFAWLKPGKDVLVVYVADRLEKEALIRSDPEKFFTTPHYDGSPSVLVRLGAVDREELAELLTDAWRLRAPKGLAVSLDAGSR